MGWRELWGPVPSFTHSLQPFSFTPPEDHFLSSCPIPSSLNGQIREDGTGVGQSLRAEVREKLAEKKSELQ